MSRAALAPVLTFPLRGGKEQRPLDENAQRRAATDVTGDERAARQVLEAAILARVVSGDVDAFEYFVVTYQRRLTRFVYALLRDPAEADGIAQDVFVKAFRALGEFKGQSAFETWLTRIAINAVRDHIRRRRPNVSFSDLHADEDDDGPALPAALDPADGTSPERDLLSRDIRRRIAQALLALSPRQRAVFVMKHYEEMSIAEIGEVTGLDEGTIKSHLFRAARKLRERLEDLR
jgi:RNA polymerase sigma-70 factor (ECF subfamily)